MIMLLLSLPPVSEEARWVAGLTALLGSAALSGGLKSLVLRRVSLGRLAACVLGEALLGAGFFLALGPVHEAWGPGGLVVLGAGLYAMLLPLQAWTLPKGRPAGLAFVYPLLGLPFAVVLWTLVIQGLQRPGPTALPPVQGAGPPAPAAGSAGAPRVPGP